MCETPGWRSEKFAWGSRTSSLPDSSKYHPTLPCQRRQHGEGVMRDHPQSRNKPRENRFLPPDLTEMRQQEKKKARESNRETPLYLWRRNNLNGTTVIRNYWKTRRKWHHFSRAKEKNLQLRNSACRENIFQKWRVNQGILRGKKIKRIRYQRPIPILKEILRQLVNDKRRNIRTLWTKMKQGKYQYL